VVALNEIEFVRTLVYEAKCRVFDVSLTGQLCKCLRMFPRILFQSGAGPSGVVAANVVASIGYHQAERVGSGDIDIDLPDFPASAQDAAVVDLFPPFR